MAFCILALWSRTPNMHANVVNELINRLSYQDHEVVMAN